MDLFASMVVIPMPDLQLVAISCLMISTKYYEMKYPSASSLNSATKNSYSYEQIIGKEGEILRILNWELLRYTVLDYTTLFLNQGCLFDSDEVLSIQPGHRSPTSRVSVQTTEYLKRYAEFFTDFCV